MSGHSHTFEAIGIFVLVSCALCLLLWGLGGVPLSAEEPTEADASTNQRRDGNSSAAETGAADEPARTRTPVKERKFGADRTRKSRSNTAFEATGDEARDATAVDEPPEPVIAFGTPNIADFCDRENVKTVVTGRKPSLEYCYEKRLHIDPGISGKLEIQWKIDAEGRVESASIASSSIDSEHVETCLERVIQRMRFEKPDGGNSCAVIYPFELSTDRAPHR